MVSGVGAYLALLERDLLHSQQLLHLAVHGQSLPGELRFGRGRERERREREERERERERESRLRALCPPPAQKPGYVGGM